MIVPVIDCSFLVFVLYSCLDEAGIFRSSLLSILFCFLICVLKMPRNKDILSCKLSVLLLVCPNIDQYCATYLNNSMHLRKCLHS